MRGRFGMQEIMNNKNTTISFSGLATGDSHITTKNKTETLSNAQKRHTKIKETNNSPDRCNSKKRQNNSIKTKSTIKKVKNKDLNENKNKIDMKTRVKPHTSKRLKKQEKQKILDTLQTN